MRYHVVLGDRTFEVELTSDGILVDGSPVEARLDSADGTPVRALHIDGETRSLLAERRGSGRWELRLGGDRLGVEVVDERTKAIRDMTGAGAQAVGPRPVVAPMPGLVVKVDVAEGDVVEEGQGVVIVEAMKMENELRAPGAGVVARVHVRPGDAVEKDQVLVDLAAPDGEAG